MSSVLSSGLKAGLDFTSPLLLHGSQVADDGTLLACCSVLLGYALHDHMGIPVLAGAITVLPYDEVEILTLVKVGLVNLFNINLSGVVHFIYGVIIG
jgi:hypothetical protein